MKREIKFRGKRVDNNQWIYGGYHKHEEKMLGPCSKEEFDANIKDCIVLDGMSDWGLSKPISVFEVDPDTVSQFTGLYDCDKKEIYEGDVIEFTDKWEWYRDGWLAKFMFARGDELKKLQKEFDALPMHRRVIKFDLCDGYNITQSDNESGYWRVVGNVWDDRNLVSLD